MALVTFAEGTASTEPGTSPIAQRRQRLKRIASQHESDFDSSAGFILSTTNLRPTIGIVTGTGMAGFSKLLDEQVVIKYSDIPGLPKHVMPGHLGELVLGKLAGKEIACFDGRFHPMEGLAPTLCALPIRIMKRMGVKIFIATGTCGALNETYRVGDFMIIKDQMNFPGFALDNPMRGYKDDKTGKRFVPMSAAYDKHLRKHALKVANDLGYRDRVHEGIYCLIPGPTYETTAEARMLRMLEGDVCGLSICNEVIIARHCEMQILGLCLVTNIITQEYDEGRPVSYDEVVRVARSHKAEVRNLLRDIIKTLD